MDGQSMVEALPRGGFERRAFDADHVKARKTTFTFPPDIPKLYMGGRRFRTHLMNGFNLFVPPFERMMVRLIHGRILPKLTDPHLIEQARGFMHQEGTHAKAHTQYLNNLRDHGYDIDGFLQFVEAILGPKLEATLGTELTLSMVAAFEHYTDSLIFLIFKRDLLDGCDPRMAELFLWHIAEEVEHNAVAYEMLRALNKGYVLRQTGNLLGLSVFLGLTLLGAAHLLRQDGELLSRRTGKEFIEDMFTKLRLVPDVAELFVHYLRPNYSPDDADYSHYIRPVLAPQPS